VSRAWNIFVATAAIFAIFNIAHDWYMDQPAEWQVWFLALWFCSGMFVRCVSDAIRGEW
jgi:hypothetical protein